MRALHHGAYGVFKNPVHGVGLEERQARDAICCRHGAPGPENPKEQWEYRVQPTPPSRQQQASFERATSRQREEAKWEEPEAPHEKLMVIVWDLALYVDGEFGDSSAKIRLWETEEPFLPPDWLLSRPGSFHSGPCFGRGVGKKSCPKNYVPKKESQRRIWIQRTSN